MTVFVFESMSEKYKRFTGKEWNLRGGNDNNYIKNNFPMVSLEGNEELLYEMHTVRDWCQEHFGDNWIYDWNDFYFVHKKDAMFFSLKWM
jgi:hypothetical protein